MPVHACGRHCTVGAGWLAIGVATGVGESSGVGPGEAESVGLTLGLTDELPHPASAITIANPMGNVRGDLTTRRR
jgi:hypothetical protein